MESCIFYKNLRTLRKSKHITQEEMGKKLGIKRSTYAHWESYSKEVRITPLLKKVILEEFGYTVDDLLEKNLTKSNITDTPTPLTTDKEKDKINSIIILLEEAVKELENIKKQ